MTAVIVVGITVGVVAGAVIVYERRRVRAWKAFAAAQGLARQRPDDRRVRRRLRGRVRGVEVQVEERLQASVLETGPLTDRRKRHAQTWFRARLSAPRLPEVWLLREDALLKAMLEALEGHEDVQVGIPEIDDAYFLLAPEAEPVRQLFAEPAARDALITLHRQVEKTSEWVLIRARGDSLQVIVHQILPRPEQLEAVLSALVECAAALDRAHAAAAAAATS